MEFKHLYKLKGSNSQENRRESLLQDQARKRNELLDEHRNLLNQLDEQAEKKKDHRGNLSNLLMLSEWMVPPPRDLETNWMFKLCPEGRRCIVIAQNGKTIAVSKQGKVFLEWKSLLPGNSKDSTILDCVFSFETKECFVLDVLHWAELPMVGTEMMFRQFWLKSRLDETPEFAERTANNKYAIIGVAGEPYSRDTLEVTLSSFPYFADDRPKVDGILFYHQEAHYCAGETPLVGWLKPFMLSEVLGVQVAPEYAKPTDYVDCLDFIDKFNENHCKKKKKKAIGNEVEMLEEGEDVCEDMESGNG